MHLHNVLPILILLPFLVLSCRDLATPCTSEFRMATVIVLTPDGEPAESVQITTTNGETGETHNPCESEETCQVGVEGEHLIFHDGLLDELTEEAEPFVVTGTKGELSFTAEFLFRINRCHIEQVAGPDTVSLSAD